MSDITEIPMLLIPNYIRILETINFTFPFTQMRLQFANPAHTHSTALKRVEIKLHQIDGLMQRFGRLRLVDLMARILGRGYFMRISGDPDLLKDYFSIAWTITMSPATMRCAYIHSFYRPMTCDAFHHQHPNTTVKYADINEGCETVAVYGIEETCSTLRVYNLAKYIERVYQVAIKEGFRFNE